MNDRFRFRAWDEQTKTCFDNAMIETLAPISTWVKNGWVVEQCTGLKDKNGRLIYEGDIILSNLDYGGTHFVIVGDVRGYCYDAVAVEEYEQYLKSNKSDLCFRLSATAYHIITDHGPCEVVGNIHENPELLEDK